MEVIKGFSKLSREEKIRLLSQQTGVSEATAQKLSHMRHPDKEIQHRFETFSENTISNHHLPFGIAPNVLIDGRLYHVPMVIEESSVIAAAAKSAKFWASHGGFQTVSLTTVKKGQVHFTWPGSATLLQDFIPGFTRQLRNTLQPITERMEQRGGGIKSLQLLHKPEVLPDYYQLDLDFETVDSMGANFINTVLEATAQAWQGYLADKQQPEPDIIMAILSNYTPESQIRMQLSCPVSALDTMTPELSGQQFAEKFHQAVTIARHDVSRAVTHNKGIMNGSDAVVLATGNDFRAVEAGVHAFAARNGQYQSLTYSELADDQLTYTLELPLAVGTVGGLTKLHPMAAYALELLGQPSARELMKIIAAAGLANNFGAVRALVTTGIQAGHMKLHFDNILASLNATPEETKQAHARFAGQTVSYAELTRFIHELRN